MSCETDGSGLPRRGGARRFARTSSLALGLVALACSDPESAGLSTRGDVEALLDDVGAELVDLFASAHDAGDNARAIRRAARAGSATVDCPRGGTATVDFDEGRVDLNDCGLSSAILTGVAMFTFASLDQGLQVRVRGTLEIDGARTGSLAISKLTVTRDRSAGRTCYSGDVLLEDQLVAVQSAATSCADHDRGCDALFGQPRSFAFDHETILPSATDPDITLRDRKHHVMVPRHGVPLRDELFVFLPGTNAVPAHYNHILRAGTFAGYRSIGLTYENTTTISEYCDADAQTYPECSYDTRQENQTGLDLSDRIKVDEANSIEHRLLALLEFLHARDPGGGWDEYVRAGEIEWAKIVVGGHSQGAGQSALIAKEHVVARAIYFSNPGDAHRTATMPVPTYDLDPWSAELKKTPPEAQYSLHHARETSSLWVGQVFDAIGLSALGAIVDIGGADPLYACSHTLTMSDDAADFTEAHNQTVFDTNVPVTASGLPLYNNAYLYLLTATGSN